MDMRAALCVGEERTPASKVLDNGGSEADSPIKAGQSAEMVYLKCGADGVRCRCRIDDRPFALESAAGSAGQTLLKAEARTPSKGKTAGEARRMQIRPAGSHPRKPASDLP